MKNYVKTQHVPLSKTVPIIIGFIVSMLVIYPTSAQEKENRKAVREEVKTYVSKNVLPVLREQRLKLENELSQEEKEKIDALREKMKANRFSGRRHGHYGFQGGAHGEKQRESLTDEEKETFRAQRKERRQWMMEAHEIVDEHEEAIESLMEELEDQHEQWRTDIKAILEKHSDGEYGKGHHSHRFSRFHHMHHPVFFLLLDPQAKDDGVFNGEGSNSRLYPNPVNGESIIEYELDKKGPVTITVFDSSGLPFKTLVNEVQEQGKYTFSIYGNDLKPGTYFYEVTTRSGTDTHRFVKQ